MGDVDDPTPIPREHLRQHRHAHAVGLRDLSKVGALRKHHCDFLSVWSASRPWMQSGFRPRGVGGNGHAAVLVTELSRWAAKRKIDLVQTLDELGITD